MLGLGIRLCEIGVWYYTTKNRYTLVLTHIWSYLINFPGNINTLLIELAKLKHIWNIILSFPGIRYMCVDINGFYLKISMKRYK